MFPAKLAGAGEGRCAFGAARGGAGASLSSGSGVGGGDGSAIGSGSLASTGNEAGDWISLAAPRAPGSPQHAMALSTNTAKNRGDDRDGSRARRRSRGAMCTSDLAISYAGLGGWGKKLASGEVERQSPPVRFRQLLALGVPAFSLSFAAVARAEEPLSSRDPSAAEPAPADRPPPAARTNHLVAGAVTTAVSYGLALGASFMVEERNFRGAKDLRIPLVGPWMAIGRTGCPESNPSCSKAALVVTAILTAFDGVVQAGGLAIIGEGLFLKTSSARPAPRKAEGPTVRAVPLQFERGGVGLGVVGSF